MTSRPRVLIVEDHHLLAESLAYALAAEGFPVAVAELSGTEAITDAVERSSSDIVLLDLDLGSSVGDGLALVAPLRDRGAQVIVVSGTSDRPRLAACLEQGAVGVLAKSTPLDKLVAAVIDVAAGRPAIGEAERLTRLRELWSWRADERHRLQPFEQLTQREAQVLGALMDGQSCEAIATAWFVSEATVRTQIRGVLTKLEVGSQLAAVATAQRAGWRPG
jgi:DNA-binding NarL/FixJ family response regulator